jgi:2,3-bisphosphoglycerate-independent phosphoglycerate mutase
MAADKVQTFDETSAKQGAYGVVTEKSLMSLLVVAAPKSL